jgi:integrase
MSALAKRGHRVIHSITSSASAMRAMAFRNDRYSPNSDQTWEANALANKGHGTRALQVYLGHRSIQHTRYTELAPTRFKDFWRR